MDEDPELVWYQDADGDGFGDAAVSQNACTQPAGFVSDSTDCDDDPLACGNGCFPGNAAPDLCDGQDQDCDTQVDEDPDVVWYQDADGDGFGDVAVTQNACSQPAGFVSDSTDCDDDPLACGNGCFPGNAATDVCDGDDQDCDTQVDEDPEVVWYQDADGDGFGDVAVTQNACTQPAGFVSDSTDCDDDPLACGSGCFPGNAAADVCDGADQDCDTQVDEDPEVVWYQDDDGDGFGDVAVTQNACTQPAGFVSDSTDCDDDPLACGSGCFPGNAAADVCDSADQDCDSLVDEDPEVIWYHDADGDGFTNGADTQQSCNDPDGVGAEWVATTTMDDCDDDSLACGAGCFPLNGAPDLCDGQDQDCDSLVDEDPEFVWYQDDDGDGFGDAAVSQNACTQPAGFVSDNTDCDDDPLACGNGCFPGNVAADICDGGGPGLRHAVGRGSGGGVVSRMPTATSSEMPR